ncbi:hypothetical protein HPB51_007319 [Rhipicephalus microplus]|uniref:CCHC-type domain-containing protein n=1 Tax=Rhipicephalus microplus TaxID=6941 RepID=A0A9J6EYR4_RHIMP|nr:hypothetical protein HPB51_007319 [Rhipicephalus microplus]
MRTDLWRTADRRPFCFHCSEPGHISRYCRHREARFGNFFRPPSFYFEDLRDRADISWTQGDAEELPFGDSQFDAYTIAFGIRNVTHIDKVLSEAYRVLKPGGRFLCLEFSHVKNPLLRSIYDNYSFQVIPVMGLLLARDWKSYQYLVESIRKFPCQDLFKEMIQAAGFKEVTYENLMNGVAAIHSGFKI